MDHQGAVLLFHSQQLGSAGRGASVVSSDQYMADLPWSEARVPDARGSRFMVR
jgi:hypothetical protein